MEEFLKKALRLSYYGFISVAILFLSIFVILSPGLPSVEDISEIKLQTPLRVYTQDKKLIAIYGEKKRMPVSFHTIPTQMQHAFLAAEDSRFYEHSGVDYQGLVRAFLSFLETGKATQGGSTITMQLARNFYLTREKKIIRKLREIFLAFRIEHILSKEKIFELYLNKIYLGQRAYGVAAAAQVYYGKKVNELSLTEIAMIAGLPKAPSKYNPISNTKRATERRNYVLDRMLNQGFINQIEYTNAITTVDQSKINKVPIEINAPYLSEMVRQEMFNRYGENAYIDGYSVYTTIKSSLQKSATNSLKNGIENYDKRHGYRRPTVKMDIGEFLNTNFVFDLDKAKNSAIIFMKKYFTINDHVPAVILQVNKRSVVVVNKNEELFELDLSSLFTSREYIDENKKKKIRNFQDIFSLGDLIRVKKFKNNTWKITQLPVVSGAIVSIDANSGALIAISGGYSFNISKFNRATQAKRQPGSSFKPFIYYSAFEKGFTPASIVNDSPKIFKDKDISEFWRPQNFGGKFYGPTRLRYALAKSRNIVSIRLLDNIGIEYALNQIKKFGIDTKNLPKDLTLSLGSGELTPLELVTAYAHFANGGFTVENYFIEQIKDNKEKVIYVANPKLVCDKYCDSQSLDTIQFPSAISVDEIKELRNIAGLPRFATSSVDKRIIFQINSMMKDVIKYGTGRRARTLSRNDIGGKTGTTNDQRDAWFCGFNRNVVTTSFIGFDDYSPLGKKEFGSSAALPIWIEFMKEALKKQPSVHLELPEDLVSVSIDSKTGLLASPNSKKTIKEIFRKENVPKTFTNEQNVFSEDKDDVVPELIF